MGSKITPNCLYLLFNAYFSGNRIQKRIESLYATNMQHKSYSNF